MPSRSLVPSLAALIVIGSAPGLLAAEAAPAAVEPPPGTTATSGTATGATAGEGITATATSDDGSAAAGYRPDGATQVGPLGSRPVLDTPYAIAVVPSEFIENIQANAPDDIFRLMPTTQLTNRQTRFFTGVTMRGFSVGSGKRVDGMPNANMISTDLEDKERVEILTGLSGFLYGPGGVGGTINYILKRPTEEPLNSVTVGIAGGESLYAHGDFGGKIDDAGTFGYRINVLGQDGDTAVDHQSITRQFISGALDWRPTKRLLVQVDGSWSGYHMDGTEPYWSTTPGVPYPDAPDADKFYGQPFTSIDTYQDHVGARFNLDINDHLTLRGAIVRRTSESDLIAVNNMFVPGVPGAYTVSASAWEYPDIVNTGLNFFLDVRGATGPLDHALTMGYFGDRDQRTNYRSSTGGWAAITGTGFNIADPVYVNYAVPVPGGAKYIAQDTANHNFVIGDEVWIGKEWGVLAGLNLAHIIDRSYSQTGATTADYGDTRVSPTATVIWKPTPETSVYGTYMEGLEKGGTAATTYNSQQVTNAGDVMPPLVSRQYEIGAKAEVGGTLLTLALFQIDKGLQYYDITIPTKPTYVQDGRQVHRGVEATSTGRATDELTLVGGITLLDAKVRENTQNPALEGKTPAGVAEASAKLYAEYDLRWVRGLTLTGGIVYTGDQEVDTLNTDQIPSSVTGDVGARYATGAAGIPLTFRLNVTNVTNEGYWLTPNSLGAPRTLLLSAQAKF